jgi:hypothetical protein
MPSLLREWALRAAKDISLHVRIRALRAKVLKQRGERERARLARKFDEAADA